MLPFLVAVEDAEILSFCSKIKKVISPSDVLELFLERLVEPAVEDRVRERRGHPDQVAEGEADSAHLLVLEKNRRSVRCTQLTNSLSHEFLSNLK